LETSIQDTPDVVQEDNGCNLRKKAIKMFSKSNSILLLFAGGINVGKEQCYVVTADNCHKASVVKLLSAGLLLPTVGGLVRIFALINCSVRDLGVVNSRGFLSGPFNAIPYCIHLCLRYKVIGIIK